MKTILPLLSLAAFIAIAMHSLNHQAMASNDEANAFIAKQLEQYKHPRKLSQAAAIAEIWNLTQADVAQPVCLFGKEGKCI